jgi:hypothetical protein
VEKRGHHAIKAKASGQDAVNDDDDDYVMYVEHNDLVQVYTVLCVRNDRRS